MPTEEFLERRYAVRVYVTWPRDLTQMCGLARRDVSHVYVPWLSYLCKSCQQGVVRMCVFFLTERSDITVQSCQQGVVSYVCVFPDRSVQSCQQGVVAYAHVP